MPICDMVSGYCCQMLILSNEKRKSISRIKKGTKNQKTINK